MANIVVQEHDFYHKWIWILSFTLNEKILFTFCWSICDSNRKKLSVYCVCDFDCGLNRHWQWPFRLISLTLANDKVTHWLPFIIREREREKKKKKIKLIFSFETKRNEWKWNNNCSCMSMQLQMLLLLRVRMENGGECGYGQFHDCFFTDCSAHSVSWTYVGDICVYMYIDFMVVVYAMNHDFVPCIFQCFIGYHINS